MRLVLGAVFLLGTLAPTPAAADSVGAARITNVVGTDGGCVFKDSLPTSAVESWDVEQGKTYVVTLSNVTDAASNGTAATMEVIAKSGSTGNQCLTATKVSTGVYQFTITMPVNACNTYPIQYGTSGCNEASGELARRSDGGNKASHLSAATFGAGCTS